MESSKEYAQFIKIDKPDPINEQGALRLNGYQNFIKNFMSINTKNDRVLLVHSTGVGKTITSLSTSIEQMRSVGGYIFIIGFSKSVFKRELFSKPEFGYVNAEEAEYIKSLRSEILKYNRVEDIDKLRDIKRRISIRMTNQIIFIGYKTLASRLFISSGNLNLESLSDVSDIEFMLSKKIIRLNNEFIKKVRLSFIICDEVHNLYGSRSLNSWGSALKYMIDSIECKVMLLSATPVSNRPEKIVNVLNLLSRNRYSVADLFSPKLTPAGEALIKKEIAGKVSFLTDRDISRFPSKEFMGTPMDFLNFIECQASKEQESAILNAMRSGDVDIGDDEDSNEIMKLNNVTPLEGKNRYINDILLPEESSLFYKHEDSYDGEILKRETIGKYSSKYSKMLDLISQMTTNQRGKIFIYHNYVSKTGVSMIKNILERNGIIQFGVTRADALTRCSKCFETKSEHADKTCFAPLTFIYATGGVSRSELENYIDLFNSKENADGRNIKIILGSQAIKESYDFKAIRNIIIAYIPDNISTLIQVLGRAIRKNSHDQVDEKLVRIYLLVTKLTKEDSFEIIKYRYKMNIFKEVKKINQILAENAIDKEINYSINYPKETVSDFMYDPPQVTSKGIDWSKLNTLRADAYFINDEVALCNYIIVKFIKDRYPAPFTYAEMLSYVLNPPFNFQRRTDLIDKRSIIASIENIKSIAINIDGQDMRMKPISGKFIMANTENLSLIDFYRPVVTKTSNKIDVNKIVNSEFNQIRVRDIFIKSLENIAIEDFNIEDGEVDLHLNIIILLVEYFNDMWLRPSTWQMLDSHDTLVKLLFFYNKFRIIIFANVMSTSTNTSYMNLFRDRIVKTRKDLYTSSDSHYEDYPALLNSTESIDEIYQESKKIKYYNYHKNKNNFYPRDKVKDNLIPIGHYFNKEIRILTANRQWVTDNNFNRLSSLKQVYIDNPKIVGFLERDRPGLHLSFKIRLNNSSKDITDSRKLRQGSICETYEKEHLIKICKMIGIESSNRKSLMCESIKLKLIDMELKARRSNSNVRFFRFYWE